MELSKTPWKNILMIKPSGGAPQVPSSSKKEKERHRREQIGGLKVLHNYKKQNIQTILESQSFPFIDLPSE
jgi:hypothetical protein